MEVTPITGKPHEPWSASHRRRDQLLPNGVHCEIEQLQCGGAEQVYIVSPEYDGAGPLGPGVGYASLTDVTDFGGVVPETDSDLLLSLHSQLFEQ